jgi:putative membrane protein
MAKGPVLIELDGPPPSVTDAPEIEDTPSAPGAARGHAMQGAIRAASRRGSRLGRWFWGATGALVLSMIGIAAWDFAAGLVARNVVLGTVLSGLMGLVLVLAIMVAVRELAALGRLRRVDTLRRAADSARAGTDLEAAREAAARIAALYATRAEISDGRARLEALKGDQLDAESLMALTEETLLGPLDRAARLEIQSAARQVATVTALVPLAFADVAAALIANLRMIRAVAEIYGGRSGLLGGWRLTRAVTVHLVATGGVAIGDDLLEPVLGGTVLAKLARRFGEGLVNGALTARVGVAAMEVCRPMAFGPGKRPELSALVQESLKGLIRRSNR